jgi:hypothetical protein
LIDRTVMLPSALGEELEEVVEAALGEAPFVAVARRLAGLLVVDLIAVLPRRVGSSGPRRDIGGPFQAPRNWCGLHGGTGQRRCLGGFSLSGNRVASAPTDVIQV